ncbi:MAG: hypothetical protein ACLQU4_11460 [Limisphaerales bacterium]
MPPLFQQPALRRIRIFFRWCRMSLWLVLFFMVAAIAYLHLIGLPDFVKRPLLRRLLEAGVVAEFSEMQLGWGLGPSVVIENAAFSRSDQPLSPRLSARRAEVELDWDALLHSRIALRSLQITSAQLQLPISETNGDALLLTNVALEMRFPSNEVVRVDDCRGVFQGIHFDLVGDVTHADDMRHWKFPLGGGSTNGAYQARLRAVKQTVEEISFTGTPLLQIEAGADGRDMNSFHAEMSFTASAVHTPWGNAIGPALNAACARLVDSGDQPLLQITGSAANLSSPLARSGRFSFVTAFSRSADSNLHTTIRFETADPSAVLDSVGSNWLTAGSLSWNGAADLASSNLAPLMATGKLRMVEARSPWGGTRELSLECRAARTRDLPGPDAAWGPWNRIAPWTLDWRVELAGMTGSKLRFDHLAFYGHWLAPELVIEGFRGDLYGGHVSAGAVLDIGSRELHSSGTTDFSPLSISQLFNPPARKWLAQFDFVTPPKVNARLRVVLPPWTNRPAGWSDDVGSSLQLAGDFTTGHASFCGVPVESASSRVTYTNRVWHVSGLHAVRPDGDIDLDYTTGPQTFHYVIDSRLEPKATLPFVAPGKPHLLDELAFRQPPGIKAEIWGSWREPGRLAFTATARAADFVARGEPVAALSLRVDFTNQVLTVHHLSLSNVQCRVQAPWLQVDFGTMMASLTNVTGSLDPSSLQRVLGEDAPDWLDAIHFDAPPSISVSGSFSLTHPQVMDLHFLVSGQGLHYTNLLADRVSGAVDWSGQTVTLTNIHADLYDHGTLAGWIVFGNGPNHGPDFRAIFAARDIGLSSLAAGITGKTNRLEGRLDGHLALEAPHNSDENSWRGRGDINVHDALLWDIKLFGLFSPVLNTISPGWGHSRVREAVGTFVITNGTASSDNLQFICQGFVLNLRGKVDRNKRITARLEAVLSRETPVVGSFLSLAFTPLSKLFEYRISGPVQDPVLDPVYLPKFIMFLLHPFHSLKSFTTPDSPAQTIPP